MARPSRTQMERERDLDLIAGFYLSGRTQAEIAKRLNVCRQQVGYDLKVLQKRWQASCVQKLDQAKAVELAKIDRLEREYWRAWRKSNREKEIKTAEKATGGDRDRTKAVSRHEQRDGNPAYLAGIQWCIERRCRILGHNAPKRVTLDTLEALLNALPYDVALELRDYLAHNQPQGPRGTADVGNQGPLSA